MTVESQAQTLSVASEVGWLVNRLNSVRADLLREVMQPLGINARGSALLTAVAELPPPVSQQEISAALNLDQPSVASVADRLQDAGLISRRRDPRNRRRYAVELTDEGRQVLAQARVVGAAVEAEMRRGLDADEVMTLHALLTRLAVSHGIL